MTGVGLATLTLSWLTQVGGGLLAWLEDNQVVGTALVALAAFFCQGFLDNRREARAALNLSLCSFEYVFERFEAAIKGELKFALRGARTTEMIEAMRELEVTSLPTEIIEAFAHVRSDVYAVNVRISEVFANHRQKAKAPRVKARQKDLVSAARVLSEAIGQFEKLNQRVSRRYMTGGCAVSVPSLLATYIATSLEPDAASDAE